MISSPSGFGELMEFAKGGRVQASLQRRDDVLRLDTPAGIFEFLPSDFRVVIEGHDPHREWGKRVSESGSTSVEHRFRLFWWGLENGLTDEAVAYLRETSEAFPKDQAVNSLIGRLDRLGRAWRDPDLKELTSVLGAPFRAAKSNHFVLLHQELSDREVEERLKLLESVLTTFDLFLAGGGFHLKFGGRKLVAVHFAERADYLIFLKNNHAGAFDATRGFYHPTRRLVAGYDARSGPRFKELSAAIKEDSDRLNATESRLRKLKSDIRVEIRLGENHSERLRADTARTRLAELRRDLDRRRLLLELDWRAIDLGIAAHETIHQLVADSHFAPEHGSFPTWLHEGLAAQFEVVRGGRWSGFGRVHDLRLPDWRSSKGAPDLVSLVRDKGFGQGYQRDQYARAWALVFFLRKTEPANFLKFLDLLRAPKTEGVADPFLASFQAAFGSAAEDLQDRWITYVNGLKTPWEDAGLAGPSTSDTLEVKTPR